MVAATGARRLKKGFMSEKWKIPESPRIGRHAHTMPKKILGTGGKHRANSPTSVRMLRLARRRAEALDYRLRGDSFAVIAQKMRINISTAHDYVVRCLENVAPRETKEAVLQLELQRLDQLQSAVSAAAAKGDTDAIETTLKIMRTRARYLGLFADGKQPAAVNLNVGANAEAVGIQVCFRDDWKRPVDDLPSPVDTPPLLPSLPAARPPSGPPASAAKVIPIKPAAVSGASIWETRTKDGWLK